MGHQERAPLMQQGMALQQQAVLVQLHKGSLAASKERRRTPLEEPNQDGSRHSNSNPQERNSTSLATAHEK